ncbi:hypothetical protein ASE31_21885 [Acidovorax sp. Root217]|nr:hypothetical protein ASE31_21885 [Acidovorax sp. Root217]
MKAISMQNRFQLRQAMGLKCFQSEWLAGFIVLSDVPLVDGAARGFYAITAHFDRKHVRHWLLIVVSQDGFYDVRHVLLEGSASFFFPRRLSPLFFLPTG